MSSSTTPSLLLLILTSGHCRAPLSHVHHPLAAARLEFLHALPLLSLDKEAVEIAQIYIDRLVMPRDQTGDALHLALASWYKCDNFLTWNFEHLANYPPDQLLLFVRCSIFVLFLPFQFLAIYFLPITMITSIEQLIANKRQDIGSLCASLAVHELRLFGSAVSGLFNPLHSDIDVMVDFYDPQAPGIADRYMALAVGLEAIFQRPVDVVTKQAMKNPVFRRIVETTSEPLYAA